MALSKLRQNLAALPAPDAPLQGRAAAVLLLVVDPCDPHLVLTQRAANMRQHAGQVSFPGGSSDPGEDPVATALRESHEECGIDPSGVEVLGQLPNSELTVSGFAVTPVIGLWKPAIAPDFVTQPTEVQAVHMVSICDLALPANRGRWRVGARSGPGFEVGGVMVWGFTAMLLDRFLKLGGWEQPWDKSRQISVG